MVKREGRVIIVSFKCPHCGEENQLSQLPQDSDTMRCANCEKEFSIEKPADPQKDAGEVVAPKPEEANAPDEAMKELAQQYFADIPDETAPEKDAPVPDSAAKTEKAWSSEDDISEEDKRLQRQQLFQIAQETAEKREKAEKTESGSQDEMPKLTGHKHIIPEKKWQSKAHWAIVLAAFCLLLLRIILGRTTASTEQFNWMQPQIVPSLLYFIAAVSLPYLLLRRTSKPQLVPALLLLIPLIFDFWYLVPGITETLPPSTLLNIGSILKIAVSAFAVIMCFKTKKHPVIK